MRAIMAAAGLAAMLSLSACADHGTAMPSPARSGSSALGPVLTDAKGMTLYTFDRDQGVKSMCNGQCAANWPPLMASANAVSASGWTMVTRDPGMPPMLIPATSPVGPWTAITRDDGTKQWAYKGKPVYTWTKDTKPGDTTGEGAASGTWHVAKP